MNVDVAPLKYIMIVINNSHHKQLHDILLKIKQFI